MAFLEKRDPVVLNIKITSKGRELLSRGEFKFDYFTLGDGEIDYDYNDRIDLFTFNQNVLKAVDKNPQILSYVQKNIGIDENMYNKINHVSVIPKIIQNTITHFGFFNITSDGYEFKNHPTYFKQVGAVFSTNDANGGNEVTLRQGEFYESNSPEPAVGDLILIRWVNPNTSTGTTNLTVNANLPTPYLTYRINEIISGSLSVNNLRIRVDRNIPDFQTITGGTKLMSVLILNPFDSSIPEEGDFEDRFLTAFFENRCSQTVPFPYWNLSILFTENIIGFLFSQATQYKTYLQHKSAKFAGFVSYIQSQEPKIKKLGIIHYTNESKSNVYGEGFYIDTPVLHIPTIMWHKSDETKIGLKLSAYGDIKKIANGEDKLNIRYYDLADNQGNVVGKIFNSLKMFVIEDQELLYAMSYKSNRSWTLPKPNLEANDAVLLYCE